MKKYFNSKLLIFIVLIGLTAISQVNAQDVLRKVDIMPEYPGGQIALNQFITTNIAWPKASNDAVKEGTVYVTFIVEKDGSITQIKANKGIGESFEKEAENVVKKMTKWTPGKQAGVAVRVMLSLPIEFKLKN